MVDTPIGSYATETTDVAQLVGMKAAGNLINVDTTKFANSLSASGATGDMYRRNSSSNVERFAIGSAGYMLGVSSGLPTWLAGLSLISQTTVSVAVSSIVFNNIPSSGYSHFLLVVHNAATAQAATTDTLNIHTSTDNGSTWNTTLGNYYNGTTSAARLGSLTVSGSTSTFKVQHAHCALYGLGKSDRATGFAILRTAAGISTTNMAATVGDQNTRMAAEADNAFRLISAAAANINQGTYQLYGVAE